MVALPDVPQNDVMTVVTTLNRADVPAPQFVEIVRYAPVAIVQPAEPRFVTYVTQEYDRGIVGEPLALAISQRYDAYGIDDVRVVNPPVVTYVEQRQTLLPTVVTTRFQPVQFDPVALVAMPLAVAAVANLTDVPTNDLMQFVTSLNQAMVPAPQFVEVVRYSPVVLVDRTESPRFVRFVSTEVDRGVMGLPLAYTVANRIQTFEPVRVDLVRPDPIRIVERDDDILPRVVTTRVASTHPHGGPPGQLKKELGLQTGAEVVHGTMPRRVTRERVVVSRPHKVRTERHVERVKPTHVERHIQQPHVERVKPMKVERAKPPKIERHIERGGGGGQGHGNGKAKGKGKKG